MFRHYRFRVNYTIDLNYPTNSPVINKLTNIKALYLLIALAYNIYFIPTSYITLSYALSLSFITLLIS